MISAAKALTLDWRSAVAQPAKRFDYQGLLMHFYTFLCSASLSFARFSDSASASLALIYNNNNWFRAGECVCVCVLEKF